MVSITVPYDMPNGTFMRALHDLTGQSQVQIARDVGIDHRTYSAAVRGSNVLSSYKLQRVMLHIGMVMEIGHHVHETVCILPTQACELIEHLAHTHRISKSEMARRCDISSTTIKSGALGTRSINMQNFRKILDRLGHTLTLVPGVITDCTWPVDLKRFRPGVAEYRKPVARKSRRKHNSPKQQGIADLTALLKIAINALSALLISSNAVKSALVEITPDVSAVLGKIREAIGLDSDTFWIEQHRLDWIGYQGTHHAGYSLDTDDTQLLYLAMQHKHTELSDQLESFGG